MVMILEMVMVMILVSSKVYMMVMVLVMVTSMVFMMVLIHDMQGIHGGDGLGAAYDLMPFLPDQDKPGNPFKVTPESPKHQTPTNRANGTKMNGRVHH